MVFSFVKQMFITKSSLTVIYIKYNGYVLFSKALNLLNNFRMFISSIFSNIRNLLFFFLNGMVLMKNQKQRKGKFIEKSQRISVL